MEGCGVVVAVARDVGEALQEAKIVIKTKGSRNILVKSSSF
jgi:hypothetical protein